MKNLLSRMLSIVIGLSLSFIRMPMLAFADVADPDITGNYVHSSAFIRFLFSAAPYLAMSLLLTLLFEVTILYFLGFKSKKAILSIIFVNIASVILVYISIFLWQIFVGY